MADIATGDAMLLAGGALSSLLPGWPSFFVFMGAVFAFICKECIATTRAELALLLCTTLLKPVPCVCPRCLLLMTVIVPRP